MGKEAYKEALLLCGMTQVVFGDWVVLREFRVRFLLIFTGYLGTSGARD